MGITIEIMEGLKVEPVDDSRGCIHTFDYSRILKSTHLTYD